MEWREALQELSALDGKPVCVTVAEAGGAGAQVATFSGTFRVSDGDSTDSDDEMVVCDVGERGEVTIERLLFEGAKRTAWGLLIGQATINLMLQDLTIEPGST